MLRGEAKVGDFRQSPNIKQPKLLKMNKKINEDGVIRTNLCVCVYIYMYMYVCICICVCVYDLVILVQEFFL